MTEIDSLKGFSNILILATSNYRELIDPAFLDRVDLSIQVPLPGINLIFKLLVDATKCVIENELIDGQTEDGRCKVWLGVTAARALAADHTSVNGSLYRIAKCLSVK